MKTTGIRIYDKQNGIVSVELPHILEEIHDGSAFYWAILFLNGIGKSMPVFMNQINHSKNGLNITWHDLCSAAPKFYDLFDVLIIGCRDEKSLHRYADDRQMYETCNFVIEMIDSGYWEIFSTDEDLIKRLASKFKDIQFLESNFEK